MCTPYIYGVPYREEWLHGDWAGQGRASYTGTVAVFARLGDSLLCVPLPVRYAIPTHCVSHREGGCLHTHPSTQDTAYPHTQSAGKRSLARSPESLRESSLAAALVASL
jgi:hypothetical protein